MTAFDGCVLLDWKGFDMENVLAGAQSGVAFGRIIGYSE
jgi:hypothetical protein